jgi:uncharacterized RDD family membrane protein YckC
MAVAVVVASMNITSDHRSTAIGISSILFLCVGWLYPVLCIIGPARGTMGDLLCGLAVVRKDYSRCHFWRALGRTLTKSVLVTMFWGILLSIIGLTNNKTHPLLRHVLIGLLVLGILAYAFAILFSRRRGLTDLVAGTIVLRRRKRYADEIGDIISS